MDLISLSQVGLIAVSISVFVYTLLYWHFGYGSFPSISDYFYVTRYKWSFKVFTIGYAAPIGLYNLISHNFTIVNLVSTLIIAVAIAADFKHGSLVRAIHIYTARGAAVCCYLSMIIEYNDILPAIISIFTIGMIFWLKKFVNNYTFWIEVIIVLSFYFTLLKSILV